MAKTIGIIGTLDTKGLEISYLASEIERRGCRVFVIDVGVFGPSSYTPAVSAGEIATAGGRSLEIWRFAATAVKPWK